MTRHERTAFSGESDDRLSRCRGRDRGRRRVPVQTAFSPTLLYLPKVLVALTKSRRGMDASYIFVEDEKKPKPSPKVEAVRWFNPCCHPLSRCLLPED